MPEPILHQIDNTIHAKARLIIMATLVLNGASSVKQLKDASGLTDGNLGSHLRVLEDAGYIHIARTFAQRKPLSLCRVTPAGQAAFTQYLDVLEQVLAQTKSARPPHP